MPTYIYKNPETGATFEIKQSIRDDALTAHPETGEAIQRMIQPVGIAFKGSGFYVNDSKSKNSASTAKASEASTKSSSDTSKASSSTSDGNTSNKGESSKDNSTRNKSSSSSNSSNTSNKS